MVLGQAFTSPQGGEKFKVNHNTQIELKVKFGEKQTCKWAFLYLFYTQTLENDNFKSAIRWQEVCYCMLYRKQRQAYRLHSMLNLIRIVITFA